MALITKPDMEFIWASGGAIVEPSDVKKQTGWTPEVPPHQWENWIQNRQDNYLAHINQRGIPQWDGNTEYEAGGLSYVQGTNGVVYKSVAASGPATTVQDPTTDVTNIYWEVAFASTTQASETVQGIVELATTSEAQTGTDDVRAMTALKVKQAITQFGSDFINTTRIDVASASTVNLTSSAPNTRHINITGTTTIAGFTIAAGQCYFVRFAGALTLTNSASLVTQTGANITTQTGDTCILRATANNAVEVLCYTSGSSSGISGSASNLKASATGTNATVTVTADSVCVKNLSNQQMVLNAVSLSINSAGAGANGLDTGTLAANTWYSVWVIWNGATAAGLLSASATAPTMPAGYTHKARIGWIRTDGTANKYPLGFTQYGRIVQMLVASGSNVPNMPLMASGVAGNPSTPTWVAVAVAAFVPTTAAKIRVTVVSTTAASITIAAPNNSYGSVGSASNPPLLVAIFNSGDSVNQGTAEMALESANIYWASSAAGGRLFCSGWEDNL